jgi:chromosome segregation ATPase
MANLNPSAAVSDLLWLQKRLSGLFDLIPKLQEVDSLENYLNELGRVLTNKEKELSELEKKADLAIKEVDHASKLVQAAETNAKVNADLILAKAQADASALAAEAREELSKELSILAAQKKKKTSEIENLTAKTDELAEKIREQELQFNELTAAIAELKARF